MSFAEDVWGTVVTRLRGTRARSRGSLSAHSRHLLKTSALSTAALVFSGIAAQGGQDDLWQPQVRAIIGADNHGANAALEGFVPLKQTAESVLFLDVRGKHDFKDGFGQDIGLGIRRIVNPDLLVGGYVYVNVQNYDGHRFTGATLGAEAIATNFDAHVNVYLPIGGDTTTRQASSSLSLVGNQLLEQVSVLDRRNYAAWGIEGEFGVQVPVDLPANHSLRLSLGGYHFGDPDGNDKSVTGAKAGLEYSIHDAFGSGTNLTFAGEIRNDNRYDTTFNGSVRLSIPFNPPRHGSGAEDEPEPIYPVSNGLRKRVNERVRGDIGVRIATQESRSSSSRAAINAKTNAAFGDFFFADGDNTLGLGTLGDPTTLDDAVAKARAGGFIVALGGKPTNIRTDGAALLDNQTVMGGQQSVKVKTANGATVDFAPAGAGGSDGTIEGTNLAANVLTLADHNTLQGIFVTGGKNGVFGNDVTGATLTNLTVSGAGESGVSFTGASTGITGSGLTSKNNGVDGLHIESDGTFNFTGTTLLLGNLDDGVDITGHGTYSFATLDAQDNGDAGITVKGTHVSGTFSTTGGTVSGNKAAGDDKVGVFIDPITAHVVLDGFSQDGGTSGVVLDHVSGSFAVAGKTAITDTSGAGIVISNSPASVRFGDVEITAPGTDAIAFKGVNATVIAGNIVVAGLGTGAGLDFANSQTTFTAQSLSITGTGAAGSIGIDLAGSVGGASVIVTEGGVIANVDTGVRLGIAGSKANTANAEFSFGGGTIGGITAALDTRGLAPHPLSGSYDFGATVFTGPILFDPSNVIFVGAAAAGAGDGSSIDDRTTIAQADANTDADAVFVLVNRGVIDAAGGFSLSAGQTLGSFGNGRTYVLNGVPINVTGDNISHGATVGDAGGAATLTNSVGGTTLTLGGGNLVNDVIIDNLAGGAAIYGTGITDFSASGATVTGTGIGIDLSGVAGRISLDDTTVSGASGISVAHSPAKIDLTGTTKITAGSGVGLALADTSGAVTIADLAVSAATDAVWFDTITSTVDVAKLTVTGGQNGIEISGAGGTFTFGAASSITGTTGTAFRLSNSASTVDYGGTIDVDSQAVSISGLGAGSVTFGGLVTASSGAVAAVALDSNTGGTISFTGGLKLTSTTATAFSAINGGTVVVTGVDNDLTAGAAAALQLGGIAAGVGGINFDRLVSTGGSVGLDLASVDTAAGNIAVNGVAFSNHTANGISAFDIGGNGGVTVGGGTISTGDPGGVGVFIGGVNTAALNFGTASGGLAIEGGAAGVVVNQSGGANTINFGTGVGSLIIGATTPPTSSGVLVLGLDAGTNVAVGNSANASTINTGGTGISLVGAGNLSVANTAIQGSGGGFDAVDYAGTATLTNVGISGVSGANSAFSITQNASTGTFDVTGLTVSNPQVGATAGGISISQSGAGAVRFTLDAGVIASPGTALASTDSGVAGSVVLAITNTSFATSLAGSKAIDVSGSGLNSTIVTAFDGNTVTGNGVGGGIVFDQVTFDASGSALAGTAVTGAGITQIGQGPAQRVAGNGLTLTDPTGSLSFGALNIFNDGGDGLSVDTKTLGTTFTLGTTTGTIDTTNGTAVYLDPLTVAMTLANVNSTNALDNGIILDRVAGSFTVQGGTISDSTDDGVIVVNSSADASFTGMSVLRAGGGGFYILNPQGGATTTIDATVTDAAFSAIEFDSDTAGSNGSIAVTGGTYVSRDSAFLSTPSTPVLPGPVSTFNIAITGGTFASSAGGLGIQIAACGCTDINITGLGGITVNTPGLASGGILISDANFNVTTPGAIRIGTPADPASGSGLALFAVTGTLDISRLDVVSASGAPALAAIGLGPADFNLAIAGGTVTATDAGAIALSGLTANVSLATVTSNAAAFSDGIDLVGVAGSFTVTGATRITAADLNGIYLADNSATITFGDTTITNPGVAGDPVFNNGIDVEGVNGTISFANIDITGIGEQQTGLDLSGSRANFTALSLDVTGTGSATAIGIDLSGTQSGSRTTITNGGTIQAVGTGAQLGTHGAGMASASDVFTFGGGSISGSVAALDTRGLSAGSGTYDFAGTTFTGPQLFDGNTIVFVGAAATGIGDGSSLANLANIDTADANTSATAVFALVNTGTIGTANGFTLENGQALVSFGNGNAVNAAGVPINVTGTNVETGGLISDSRGAATLVRGTAGNVVTLGGGNRIDDVIIANTSGTGAAVSGTGISGLSSSGASLSGADYGLQLVNVSGTVTLDNLTAGATGTGIQINSSPATVDFTGTTTLVAATGAGFSLSGANGAVTIADMSINAGTGDAFLLDGAASNVDVTRLTVTQAATGIHVVNGSTGTFTFGPTSSITGTTASAFTLAGSAASVTYDGSIGTTSGQAVSIDSLGAGSVSFGGLVTASSGAANAVELANNTGGTISFTGGLKLTSTSGKGFSASGGGTLTVTGADNDVTSGSGISVDIENMTVGAGNIAFDQLVADGGAYGLRLVGDDVSAGGINVADVDFVGISTTGVQIQDIKGGGSITVGGGSIGLAGGAAGVSISGTTDAATYNIATAVGGLAIDGGAGSTGIVVNDAGAATINIGTGAGALAIGGTARTGTGIRVDALASAASLTVGNAAHASSIKSVGTAITVGAVGGDVAFVNTAIDSSAGSGMTFADYAGTATLTGVSISGMGGAASGLSISQGANAGAFDVTGLTISNYQVGATGGGVTISEAGTGAVRFSLGASRISSAGNAFDSRSTGPTAASVVLAIDDTTFETADAGSKAINVANLGLSTATIVTSLDGNTVVGNGTGGGMFFSRAVFDASGATLSGTPVVSAGTTQIGQDATHRVMGDGLSLLNTTGSLNLGTLTVFNSGGTGLEIGKTDPGAPFTFGTGAGSLDTSGASAINISSATLDVTLGQVKSTDSTSFGFLSDSATSSGMGIGLDSTDGSFTVTGATSITNAALGGIRIAQTTTTAINFGATTISLGLTSGAGIGFSGTNGDVTFGATTISNVGNTQTGIDFSGSGTTADFGLTTITGTVGSVTSRGIDLSSTTGNRTINFLTGSAISGVAIGVDLSSSETTATTANAAFTFGDGDATVPNGRNSTISATKYTVNTVGLNPALGSYNFNDVAFTGDANLAAIANSAILVSQSGGVVPAHDAARGDLSVAVKTISIGDADAILDPTATFAFVGTIDLANTTFTLQSGQTVTGFGNGNTVASGTYQPANVSGNLGGLGGSAITGDAGVVKGTANLIQLSGNNQVRHTTFDFAGATGSAFFFGGGAGDITVEGVTIRNVAAGQSAFSVAGFDNNLSIVNNTIDIAGKLLDVSGGTGTITVTRGTLPNSATAGTLTAGGIAIANRTGGAVTFTDQVTINGGGVNIVGGSAAAAVNFNGGLDITSSTATGLDLSGLNVLTVADAGSTKIEATGQTALSLQGTIGAGGLNFSTVKATGAAIGIGLTNVTSSGGGAIDLGATTLTGITSIGVDINGTLGAALDFDSLAVGLAAINATGLDLSAAAVNANITAGDFDVVGGGNAGTLGINMAGTTTPAGVTIQLGNTDNGPLATQTSTIAGVATGVRFSGGLDGTGGTNAHLVFGDGQAPAESSIATFGGSKVIDTPDTLPTVGTYNFNDVNFTGDTSNLESSVTYYYVDNFDDGINDGSRAHPGTIADALLSPAKVIVLVNHGGTIDLNGTSLTLDDGQALIGFRDGDVDITTLGINPGGAPSSFSFSTVNSGGTIVTDPISGGGNGGAVTLTTSNTLAFTSTVTLAGSNGISGVVIANGGIGSRISGNNISALTLLNSTVGGGAASSVMISSSAATVLALSNLTLTSGAGFPALLIDGTGGTMFITRFDGLNVVGGGIGIRAATFDADPTNGTIDAVSGGNSTIGTALNRVSGSGLSLTNVSGKLDYIALNIANTNGTGLIVDNDANNDGVKETTFTLKNTSGMIDTTNGAAMNLDPLNVDLTFASITAAGGASGIIFDGVAGTVTISGPTTITGTSGYGISAVHDNSGGTFNFNGAVTIDNTASIGGGVSHNGGTTNFNGGLTIGTTTGTGFNATGGGIVTVQGANNTITSTGGTALNVVNTTIGSAGLTFKSISAGSATNSAATGIILDTTGTLGGLTITGTGTAGSGGTIQHKTGADGSRANGIGIYLNNTSNVSLNDMNLHDFQNFAVRGFGVNGFAMNGVTISGTNGSVTGATAADDAGEGAVFFGNANADGLSGTVSITNSSISGGAASNLSIIDTSNTGGALHLTLDNDIFGLTQNLSNGRDSVRLEARNAGTTSHATITNSTFQGALGDLLNITGQAGTTMDVIVGGVGQGNTFANTPPDPATTSGGGFTLSSHGVMRFDVENNTFTGAKGSAVTMQLGDTGTSYQGTFSNNTIGTDGIAGSGSAASGNGIYFVAAGAGTATLAIDNNIIQGITGNAGIYMDNTGGSYTVNATITNNLIRQFGAGTFAGIVLTNGANSSPDTVNVFAKITGNTIAGPYPAGYFGDIVLAASGAAGGHSFTLSGASVPNVADEATIQDFLAATNTTSFVNVVYSDNLFLPNVSFTASSSLPPLPTAPTP